MSQSFFFDYHTENADTEITELVTPVVGRIPMLTSLTYTSTGTDHTITLMRCIAKTRCFKSVYDLATATIELESVDPGFDSSGDPLLISGGDWLAWEDRNGQWKHDSTGSVTGNVVTLASNHTVGVRKGAPVWVFYGTANAVHHVLKPPNSDTKTFEEMTAMGGISVQLDHWNARTGAGEPAILHVDNATAAGSIDQASGVYI